MKYPHYEVYENLYKRYFEKGVDYLILPANLKENDIALDICGGNGRLSKEIFKRTKFVTYLDKEKNMTPKNLENLGIQVINESVEKFVKTNKQKFTKVFCEQAINYWLKKIDIKLFSNIFESGALFIFNTFSVKPSEKPMIKNYNIDGKDYLEISYLTNNKVNHIQICENYAPHFTQFDWISKEEYFKILSPYFEINLIENNKSSLYICKRRYNMDRSCGNYNIFNEEKIYQSIKNVLSSNTNFNEYTSPKGISILREKICSILEEEWNIKLNYKEMLITTGSQQSLKMLCELLLCDKEKILIEQPSYYGMLNILKEQKIKTIGFNLEDDGPNLKEFEQLVIKHKPKYVYVVPTFNNPVGICWSNKKRIKFLKIINKYNITVIEDDPYSYINFSSSKYKSLYSLNNGKNII